MVEGGFGNGIEVGVAAGHGQGGIFGQGDVLAIEARHDHPQGLGHHDPPQGDQGRKPEGAGRFPLALGHGGDAPPHHLGNKGRRVNNQPGEQGAKFHREAQGCVPNPASELGQLPLPTLPKPAQIQPRLRQHKAGQLNGSRPIRQGQKHHEIPKDQLQQQRDIAHQFHIAPGQTLQQTVAAKGGRAHRRAQQGGPHQAHHHHLQGVDQTSQQGQPIGLAGRKGNRGFGQIKPRRVIEPTPTQQQAGGGEIAHQIAEQKGHHHQHHQARGGLHRKGHHPAITPPRGGCSRP